ELHQRTQAAVEVTVVLVAVCVAGQGVALAVGGQAATHAGLDAPAVEVQAAAGVELLVGNAGQQVGTRGDGVVVAHAGAPLVEVDVGVVDLLVGELTEQVEVGGDGTGPLDGPAVGIGTVDVGGGVAGLDIVVGHAVCGGSGERQRGEQAKCEQGLLHWGLPSLCIDPCLAAARVAPRNGTRQHGEYP